jgi:hypothetical protein
VYRENVSSLISTRNHVLIDGRDCVAGLVSPSPGPRCVTAASNAFVTEEPLLGGLGVMGRASLQSGFYAHLAQDGRTFGNQPLP